IRTSDGISWLTVVIPSSCRVSLEEMTWLPPYPISVRPQIPPNRPGHPKGSNITGKTAFFP
ncbi:MAG: hypothetical protein ACKO23_16155, partial [Gemmataceae bacterium]